jgi:hypothetical protein
MRRSRPLAAALAPGVALGVVLAAAPAAAGGADVRACRQAYEGQRYEQAAALCTEVAGDPAAPRAAITAAWELIGMANLVLGRTPVARAAFCQALAADPRHRPSDPIYPARFVAVFDAVRAAGCAPALRLETEPEQRAGVLVAVRVRVRGEPPEGSQAVVWYRHPGEAGYRRGSAAATGGAAVVEIPGLDLRRREVELYVTLTTDAGRALARSGTPDRPRRLLIFGVTPGSDGGPGGPATPLWRRGWVWWTAGGIVLTTVVVSVALSARGGGGAPHGTLGTLTLP